MKPAVAVVGLACRYPEAASPRKLWDNVLAQRRAFRRLPPERLRLEDYAPRWEGDPDSTELTEAALLEGVELDRVRFRVPAATYRAADPAHWLALEVAADALEEAGFGAGAGLPRETTGVLVGNSLTGELSRAGQMRLRWPYVRRVLGAALAQQGWDAPRAARLLEALEGPYKAPFEPPGEETLAGSLSNTIAGRICNHFDLHGGGYTLDGACASSLLAVANACSALAAGDLDLALAGGVDLSLDPFELVGFARAGALARDEMRLYDARSAGFWPGEGCGFAVLMRLEDALDQGRPVVAVVRGWGISSDGGGGITRPEVAGQRLALERAYRRAGFGIETVPLFEGHGTGTAVGDATELAALTAARRATGDAPAAAIGSVKANIGHTKAAAGAAGLIKACCALRSGVLPPTTGCADPHPLLREEPPALRVLARAEPWPAASPRRAGVSGMGFGGLNVHLALEGHRPRRRRNLGARERRLEATAQDAELFLLAAADEAALAARARELGGVAGGLSRSELADLAAHLASGLAAAPARAAVVASRPADLAARLEALAATLERAPESRPTALEVAEGLFLGPRAPRGEGSRPGPPRIALLFPGQASPPRGDGGSWRRRFPDVEALYRRAGLPAGPDERATEVAQPALVAASLAALRVLARLGVEGTVGVGHSLGELSALAWAGALDEGSALRLARARGRAMAEVEAPAGAMASLSASPQELAQILAESEAAIAGYNGPRRTVVSGPLEAVERLLEVARRRGVGGTRLPVSHAFHSPLVAPARPALAASLARERLSSPKRLVVSTVTGEPLPAEADLGALLLRQVTAPVRFHQALAAAAQTGVDLWLEVGPGRVLTGLASDLAADLGEGAAAPAVAVDACGDGVSGLLGAVAAAFVLGAPVKATELFRDRSCRPFSFAPRRFLANPCEAAPLPLRDTAPAPARSAAPEPASTSDGESEARPRQRPGGEEGRSRESGSPQGALEVVRNLVAARAELPAATVAAGSRLLSDLHLSSIAVAELVADAARALGLEPPLSPTDFANATVGEVATALEGMAARGESPAEPALPPGLASWVRSFRIAWEERPIAPPQGGVARGRWEVFAPAGHALASGLVERLGGVAREAPGDSGEAAPPGVALLLPASPAEGDPDLLELLLAAARRALDFPDRPFLLLQGAPGAAAFARTLHLERGAGRTVVVEAPLDHPRALKWALAETRVGRGFTESRYDAAGVRRVPVWRLLPGADDGEARGEEAGDGSPSSRRAALPRATEVLLVTGGGRGIAAECALALARESGCTLALLGRSRPEESRELAANLERLTTRGVPFRYLVADVADPSAVARAVASAAELGPITGLLHGAGVNSPRLLAGLDREAVERTLAPKLAGLRHLLAALDAAALRVLVTFGSVIARTGLAGAADYALANEALSLEVERFAAAHPGCRCLNAEWSVWSGVGMGERLGRLEALLRQGITPIPPDAGIRALTELLGRRELPVSVLVSGRFGDPSTVDLDPPELPFLRFLERTRVHVPGVELVAEADLGADSDPYLGEHVYGGERLLPAVLGLEAMAQAAVALAGPGAGGVEGFDHVRFERPVAVPEGEGVTLRLAAQARGPGRVEVALRSSASDFQVDCFRAVCRLAGDAGARLDSAAPRTSALEALEEKETSPLQRLLPLDPATELYGLLLPHQGRFLRLRAYRLLRATECLAELAADGQAQWFGRALPEGLLLGDPGARDAAIHALQACIPHATVVPVGVERLEVTRLDPAAPFTVAARERRREGRTLVYDLEVRDGEGRVRERWRGLRLRIVGQREGLHRWPLPLLGPYLERRCGELLPGADLGVALSRSEEKTEGASGERAVAAAAGTPVAVTRRPDGKPEPTGGGAVSLARSQGLVLAVTARRSVGCDLEAVRHRSARSWRDLLGAERWALCRRLAEELPEGADAAATRVWAAGESLKKAGLPVDAPLVLAASAGEGWALLRSGPWVAATLVTTAREVAEPLALALAAREETAGEAA